ncbi:MAG: Ig-like domain-containing protein [Limisphaerales bacterium]
MAVGYYGTILESGTVGVKAGVANVRANQRPGTTLVDLFYDLSGAGSGYSVAVAVSSDGGAFFTVPATHLTGDGVTSQVAPGTGRHIVWDAGADFPGRFSTKMQFKVVANSGSDSVQAISPIFTLDTLSSFSEVTASPSSALADGQSVVTVTVRLRDSNGQPVAGKVVRVSAIGTTVATSVTQPGTPTDPNGLATATLTATTPGTVLIAAMDVTDGIALSRQSQQPMVTFTADLVTPNAELTSAIEAALTSTAKMLVDDDNAVAKLAVDEGSIGDYFRAKVSDEAAQALVDVVFFAVAKGFDPVVSKLSVLNQILEEVDETAANNLADYAVQKGIEGLAVSKSGLSTIGQAIAATSRRHQAALASQSQRLLTGIPSASTGLAGDWHHALDLRNEASQVLLQALQYEDSMLQALRAAAQAGDGGVSDVIGYSSAVGTVFLSSPVGLAVGLAALDYTLLDHYQSQREALQGCQTAWSSLVTCSEFGTNIYRNTAEAFTEIARGPAPNVVTGLLLAVHDTGLWTVQKNLSNPLWGSTAQSTPAVVATASSASTVLDIQNTSGEAATFQAFAFYQRAGSGAKIVVTAVRDLGPVETGPLELVYYDGHTGAVPSVDSPIQISVLGWNHTGAFYIGSGASPIQMNLFSAGTSHPLGRLHGAPAGVASATNVVLIPNPISSFISQDPTNQSYQALILVANPFLLPLRATVTQPIPSGVTVLATDGAASDSAIIWTNTIQSNALATVRFSFSLSTMPGATTNLPAPSVVFDEPGTTNNLGLPSVAPNFTGLFPVQVSGSIPMGIPGTNATMLVTVTNLTSANRTGSVSITLTNSTLELGTNLVQPFAIGTAASTNLTFALPGSVPAGLYAVTGLLSVNGGGGQVLAGVYTMPPPRVLLGLGPSPFWSTNGLSLTLEGPINSDHLIQMSTNLVNWTPIQYFRITDSPFYFSDSAATNSIARFYRSVMP